MREQNAIWEVSTSALVVLIGGFFLMLSFGHDGKRATLALIIGVGLYLAAGAFEASRQNTNRSSR